MYICVHVCLVARRSQKRALDPLEPELQAVVNHTTVGVETDPGPLQEQQVLLTAGLFLQFPKMSYIYFYPDF